MLPLASIFSSYSSSQVPKLRHIFQMFHPRKVTITEGSPIHSWDPPPLLFACVSAVPKGRTDPASTRSAKGSQVPRFHSINQEPQQKCFTLAPLLQGACTLIKYQYKQSPAFYSPYFNSFMPKTIIYWCTLLVHLSWKKGDTSVKELSSGAKLQSVFLGCPPPFLQGFSSVSLCLTLSLSPNWFLIFLWLLSCASGPILRKQ